MRSKNKAIVDLVMNGTMPKNIVKVLNKPLSSLHCD